jgi:hypothetical protein
MLPKKFYSTKQVDPTLSLKRKYARRNGNLCQVDAILEVFSLPF